MIALKWCILGDTDQASCHKNVLMSDFTGMSCYLEIILGK